MVDIRQEVCGVIVAGTPAPGINGVISAVVIKCLSLDILPIGFLYGFTYLKMGITKYYQTLRIDDVTRVHNRGGCILFTSKEQLTTDEHVQNCVRALQHLRIKYLITIGGNETAFSAHKLACAFRERSLLYDVDSVPHHSSTRNGNSLSGDHDLTLSPHPHHNSYGGILITHVPKTIFNDLPLPANCFTFGFNTAREIGVKIVSDLSADAKCMNRWYIITVIGTRSGHLTLGIGTAAAATICLIPEEFMHQKMTKYDKSKHDQKRKEIQQTVKTLMADTEFMRQNEIPQEIMESLIDTNAAKKESVHSDDHDSDEKESKAEVDVLNGVKEKLKALTIETDANRQDGASEFVEDTGVDWEEYVDILDATMIKRAAEGKLYGVVVVSEGLVDLLKKRDLDRMFGGSLNQGHELFALKLKEELMERWAKRRVKMFMKTKFVGFELRSVESFSFFLFHPYFD